MNVSETLGEFAYLASSSENRLRNVAKICAKTREAIRNPLLYPAELRAQFGRAKLLRSWVRRATYVVGKCLMKSTMVAIALMVIGLAVAFNLVRPENRNENNAMNALMVIMPYKYEGLWVFDDAAVGLNKEPFIAGIDTLIDKATANIPDPQHGFRAIFSATQFPGVNFKLEWRLGEVGGTGITVPNFNKRAGFVRRCSNISKTRRERFM